MIHRLLCCSDTHGEVPPLVDETSAIAWLHGGDLCNGAEASDLLTDDPLNDPLLEPVSRWFAGRSCPVLTVAGNHDVVDLYHAHRWARDISGQIVRVAEGLWVAGVGWHGERYYELPYERDLEPVCQSVVRASRMISPRDCIVLLTHYPPRFRQTREVPGDADGGGVWFDCVKRLVEELNIVAVVQGHNHRWFGDVHRVSVAERDVLLVNPGPAGCVLAIDTDQPRADVQRAVE